MPGLCFVKYLAAAKASLPRKLDLPLLQGTGTLKDACNSISDPGLEPLPFNDIRPLFGFTLAGFSTSG